MTPARISRRSVALGLPLAGIVALPSTSAAQTGAEPLTAMEIAQGVAAVVGFISGASDRERDRRWRREIDRALRRIDFKIDEVLRAIQKLQIQLNEDQNRRELSRFSAVFRIHHDEIQTIASSSDFDKGPDSELAERTLGPSHGLSDQVQLLAMIRDGQKKPLYAGFPTAVYGLGALQVGVIALDSSAARQKFSKATTTVIDYLLKPAIDPSSQDSFAAVLKEEEAKLAENKLWLEQHANRVWLSGAIPSGRSSPTSTMYYGVRSDGNLERGYQMIAVPGTLRTRHPPYPGISPARFQWSVDRVAKAIHGEVVTHHKLYVTGVERTRQLREVIKTLESSISDLSKVATNFSS